LLKSSIKDVDKFTDDFIEALKKYQDEVRKILEGENETEVKRLLDRNTDKKVKRAVDLILSFSKPNENKL
jgi:hypothetical protein